MAYNAIYIDIDGTLTEEQRLNAPPIIERIEKVIELCKKEIVYIWSGNHEYADKFCKLYGIKPSRTLGKPKLVVDNDLRIAKKIQNVLITPEEYFK